MSARTRLGMVVAALVLCTSGRAQSAATITIMNLDPPGVGFNDPTAAAPVGGNAGTTIGAQRLNAFNYAASLWGARLTSTVPIVVGARFGPLTPCTPESGVLGFAGPTGILMPGAVPPYVPADTWVSEAEGEKLLGANMNADETDIDASFNGNIGTADCLTPLSWYYGFDSMPPAEATDFVTVLLHELGHGLGFLTFVDGSTGEKFSGFDDIFEANLMDNLPGSGPNMWTAMTDAERVASAINTNNVVWTGTNVTTGATATSGQDASGRKLLYTPNPPEPGSSVVHWTQSMDGGSSCAACTDLTPIDLMRPAYTGATHSTFLTHLAMEDMGWGPVAASCGGPVICTNGTFETDFAGWKPYGTALELRLTSEVSHGGSKALMVLSDGGKFGVNDSPNLVTSTTAAGAVYQYRAWVHRGDGGGYARLRVREYADDDRLQAVYSPPVELADEWQELSVDVTAVQAGSSFDLQVLRTVTAPDLTGLEAWASDDRDESFVPAPTEVLGGDFFFLDDVSIRIADETVPDPANLCGNPSFESGADGWSAYHGAFIDAVENSFAHSGTRRLLVSRSAATSDFGVNDSPNWVSTTGPAGSEYRFSAWVSNPGQLAAASDAASGSVRLKVREYKDKSQVGSTWYSEPLDLSSTWTRIVLNVTTLASGSSLDFQIVASSEASVFSVDDVSIQNIPVAPRREPALALASAPAFIRPAVSPNPSAGATTLKFSTSRRGAVHVALFDIAGRLVRTVADDPNATPGAHAFEIATDASGARLGAGVYFYHARLPEGEFAGRIAIVR